MNIIFTFLSFFGILLSASYVDQKNKPDKNEVVWTIKNHSKKLKKEKNISLVLYGTNCSGSDKIYDGKVHTINVGYRVDKKLQYDEARILFYSIVDDLLSELNKNDRIKDFFYHYPVTYQDLYCILSFDYEKKGHLSRDDVSMISILENEIMYFIVEEDGVSSVIEMDEVSPNVHKITGMSKTTGKLKTRCITRQLPEEDISNPLETSKKQSTFKMHF